jgi:hypothetical protein
MKKEGKCWLGMVIQVYNPSTQEAEAGDVRPCLRKKVQIKNVNFA